MASSSTLSIQKRFKYDVFLSYRGEDVSNTFVDHLYTALTRQGIYTYKGDKKLEKGERIDNMLIKSIEDSKFLIIIFSKNYASSSWCLDELLKIMECRRNTEQIVYPVFYDVDPSEVRKQYGSYGEALEKHIKKDKQIENWREALQEAGSLAGYHVRKTANGNEAEVIKLIVAEISKQLYSSYLSNDKRLIGMETQMQNLLSCLEIGSNDVRMIGIWGMGGVGKTTLARAIFDMISCHFEGVSFVNNVRENSKASVSGLQLLQTEVLSDVLKMNDITVSSFVDGQGMMKKRLCCIKALLVLDDVDDVRQLEALAGAPDWFKPGSRIIITTRDEHVLVRHGVKIKHVVNLLSDKEAMCLFSRYAFQRDIPIKGYEKLSFDIVRSAAGLPLTIKVLGSLLCGKEKAVWIDALERLKTIPLKETQEKLKLSYISLEDDYKEIFLDVACLLRGWKRDKAIRLLESFGFNAEYGLKVLEQNSLITIDNNKLLGMHDLIEEMGRNIVRRSLPNEPSKHSRLWISDEIEDILANDMGTDATAAIVVATPVKLNSEIVTVGFGKMKNLKALHLVSEIPDDYNVNFEQLPHSFPDALHFLSWVGYPHSSLPKTYHADNLDALEMPYSRIVQLWEEGERKVLTKLKFLNLSHSKLRTFDLRLTPNLKVLSLEECHDLVELHIPVACPKLISLDLSHSKLRTLDLRQTPNLKVLNLRECRDLVELDMPISGSSKLRSLNLYRLKLITLDLGSALDLVTLRIEECHDLEELDMPIECLKLISFDLRHSKLRTLDLRRTLNLKVLNLRECHDLVELDMPISGCSKLISLDLSHSKLRTLDLRQTPNLKVLNLMECHDLVELDMPISGCSKLMFLNLYHLKLITLDLGSALNLVTLRIEECHDLEELDMPIECLKLMSLDLSQSKLRALDLGQTSNLEVLSLKECHDLVELDMPISGCSKLRSLNLRHLKLITLDIGSALNLETLLIEECHDLEKLDIPVECLKLMSLELNHSNLRTLILWLFPNLKSLSLKESHDLVALHMPFESLKLMSLELSHSKLMTLDLKQALNLERLNLQDCNHLVELYMPVGRLKSLVVLNLSGCSEINSFSFIKALKKLQVLYLNRLYMKEFPDIIPGHSNSSLQELRFRYNDIEELPSSIENLQKLVYLDLHSCREVRSLPGSICNLRHLRNLKLYGCRLENLPEDIGKLECLEKLNLSRTCIKLLPESICKLKRLKSLNLSSCWNLEGLPEDIGQLECLQVLNLTECTQVTDIPDSICKLKSLKYFCLLDCIQLKKLPAELGALICLEVLNVKGTRIRHLPQSISLLINLKLYGPESGIRLHFSESSYKTLEASSSKPKY